MEFNKIYPELVYTCPMTGEKFGSHRTHCLDNPPCLYFNSTQRDGWGDSVVFDVIICEFPQSSSRKVKKDA